MRDRRNPPGPTPTQARQVLAVARANSFSKAALALGSSQSALSNAVASLEEQLGLTLFVRTTRHVAPTRAFDVLKRHFERLVKATEAVEKATAQVRGLQERTLRIGISPVVDTDRLESSLRAFERRHPKTSLELIELNLNDLLRDLEAGLLEVVIAPLPGRRARVKGFKLYQEPLLLVRARGTADALDAVALKSVAHEVFLMVPDICGLALTTAGLFAAEGFKLRRAKTQALGYHLLERGALNGRGLAILPRSRLSASTRGAPLVCNTGAHAQLVVQILQRRHGRPTAGVKAFTEQLRRDAIHSTAE